MEIWFPRMFDSSSGVSPRMSVPANRISPPRILPGGLGTSLRMDEAVTLFPQPDSPDDPEGATRVNLKGHTVHRVEESVLRFERNLEVVDLEKRRKLVFGSTHGRKRSRIP